jgi:hypothetical protein
MNDRHRQRSRSSTGRRVTVAAPPANRLWLIATHRGRGQNSEGIWASYARRSHAPVARMNATATRWQGAAASPPAALAGLGAAVGAITARPHTTDAVLVMFMHGIDDTTRSFGFLHSTGQTYSLDERWLSQPNWSDRVLVIGWPRRNSNSHYLAFTAAVRAATRVKQVHLYGCKLGGSLIRTGLLDLASDLHKEIWAYTGYTHTTSQRLRIIDSHSESAPSAYGASVSGATYSRVMLEANNGDLLPGWHVRAYMAGAEPRLDIFESGGIAGPNVEIHNRRTLNDVLGSPIRSISL